MNLVTALLGLAHGDPKSAGLASRLLAEAADGDASRALADALCESEVSAPAAIGDFLAGACQPRVVTLLIPLLKSDRPRVRNAARGLLERTGPSDPEALIRLSRDTDPRMRLFAAGILGAMGGPAVVARLLELLSDPDGTVLDSAVVALGQARAAEAVPAITRHLQGAHPWVRLSALDALISIGGPEAERAILAALPTLDEETLRSAVDALGQMVSEEAVEPLVALLASRPETRPWVLRTLSGPLAGAVRLKSSLPVLASLVRALEEDLAADSISPRLAGPARKLLDAMRASAQGGKG